MKREEQNSITGMFERISKTYDLLNRLLSFGLDLYWRNSAAKLLEIKEKERILDLCAGTGDMGLAVVRKGTLTNIVGVDAAQEMLKLCAEKFHTRGYEKTLSLVCADAGQLPFGNDTFDGMIVGFGVRNVVDLDRSLGEIYRVLRSSGRSVVLEFSRPTIPILKAAYFLYFKYVLTTIGGLVSGDTQAYRYLYDSTTQFAQGDEFLRYMEQAGFEDLEEKRLTFGIVSLYCGVKVE